MFRRTFTLIALSSLMFALPLVGADDKAIKVLIITGDHGHAWKETTPYLKEFLTKAGLSVDVTETPAKDLTPANLSKYDVLLLNYKDTKNGGPDTKWSDDNKKAFTEAVKGGNPAAMVPDLRKRSPYEAATISDESKLAPASPRPSR